MVAAARVACRGRKRLLRVKEIRRRTVASGAMRAIDASEENGGRFIHGRNTDADEKGEEKYRKERDATIARTENGLLHRRAAREAMKLIEDVKRNELSAMDIVCLIPILVDDGTKNTTPFDANDPMKWPKNLVHTAS